MSVVKKTTSPSVFTSDFTLLVRGKRKGETAGEYISKYTAGLGSTTSRVLHISPQCLFLLKYKHSLFVSLRQDDVIKII